MAVHQLVCLGTVGLTAQLPTLLQQRLGASWQTTYTLLPEAPIARAAGLPLILDAGAAQHYVLAEVGSADLRAGQTADRVIAALQQYALGVRAQGWVVLLCTILPRADWGDDHRAAEQARTPFEQARVQVNDALLTTPRLANAIVDLTPIQDLAASFLPRSAVLNTDGLTAAAAVAAGVLTVLAQPSGRPRGGRHQGVFRQ